MAVTILTSMTKPVANAKAIKIDNSKDTNLYTVELKGNTQNAPLCWPRPASGKGVGVYSLYWRIGIVGSARQLEGSIYFAPESSRNTKEVVPQH